MAIYRIKRFAVVNSKFIQPAKRVTVPSAPMSMKTGEAAKINVNLKNKIQQESTITEANKILNQNYKQLQTPINFDNLDVK